MDEAHQTILRRHHRMLVNTIDLSKTSVLDRLLEEDMISSGEQDDIMSRNTSRDQNTRLLFVLKRRGPGTHSFDKFILAIESDYEFVANKLKACEDKHTDQASIKVECVHCWMLRNLIPNNVSHFLFEEGLISDDDLEELNNKDISRQDRVKKLLSVLQKNSDPNNAAEKFRLSLEPKYRYLLTISDDTGLDQYMFCRCRTDGNGQEHEFIGETASTVNDPLTDRLKGDDTYVLTANSRMAETDVHYEKKCEFRPEQEQSQYSIIYGGSSKQNTNTSKIKHMHSKNRIPVEDSEEKKCEFRPEQEQSQYSIIYGGSSKQNTNTIKIKHMHSKNRIPVEDSEDSQKEWKQLFDSKKSHKRRPKIAFDEPDSINSLSSVSMHERPRDQILQHVAKVLPNDKKLMRKCTKIWDNLFVLREKGDWTTFNLVSSKAFKAFDDNPDVKVLLYRSEMCVSTFYKNDPVKAMAMFEQAMKTLPKTSMPNWHLARILPLRMELCTREKQFEEASNLLEQAHQAMATLKPCLSTGAVYFFEAIYLGTILRCTRSNTKAAESIAQRVKSCFLTAIDHYQQEQFFAIKSFLNQVYLFFALFILGVDFKSIRYIGIRSDCQEDIDMAEHYLTLFENNCWETSTTWSRMLFYIGQGEKHKLRNNLHRSLEYYESARQCSVLGGFQEHLDFIEQNMKVIGEKLQEKLRFEALQTKSADDILQSLLESTDESGSGEN